MGFFDIFKRSKKEILEENKRNGKEFEDDQENYHKIMGNKVTRRRKGPDAKIESYDILTGKIKTHYEEWKSSPTAPLSKAQKEFIKKHPKKTKVIRKNNPLDIGNIGLDFDLGSSKKNTSRKKRKKNDDPFGGFGDIGI